jgi:hypothetical protein
VRQLHPVSIRETFVASGVYTFYENGQTNGVVEYWNVYQLPDGSQIVRVDYDARKLSRTSILLEALCNFEGRIERFDIAYYHDGESPVKRAKANYTVFDGYVEIGRTLDDGERIDQRIDLPKNAVIYPSMHVFVGSIIKQVLKNKDTKVPMFHPNIMPSNLDAFLQGEIDYATASLIGQETLEVSGKQVETRLYRFIRGLYPTDSRFWLNERDFLVQSVYKSDMQIQISVLLAQYAHRP